MSLTITLTGTGGAQLVPTFGCDCAACQRARLQAQYRRRPCSGVVKFNNAVTLLDAGIPHLMDDWPAGSFQGALALAFAAIVGQEGRQRQPGLELDAVHCHDRTLHE